MAEATTPEIVGDARFADEVAREDFHDEAGGKRLLIVDDNATNREIVTRIAESWTMLPVAVADP